MSRRSRGYRDEATIVRETDEGDVTITIVFEWEPGEKARGMDGPWEYSDPGTDAEITIIRADGDDGYDYTDDISDSELDYLREQVAE